MKTLRMALCALALCSLATAANLTTSKGVTYQDYKITAVEKESVRIVHGTGTATIDFDELPAALQAQYGWTAEKSAARKAKRAAEAEAQRKQMESARLAAEQAQKAQQEAARANAEHARIAAANAAAAERRAEDQKKFAAETLAKQKKEEQERAALMSQVFFWTVIFFAVVFAFIPTFMARGKPQFGAVFFLNLMSLFGGFGHSADDRIMAAAVYVVSSGIWITAFILALKSKPEPPSTINVMINQPPAPRQIQARPIAATPRPVPKAIPPPRSAPPPPPPA